MDEESEPPVRLALVADSSRAERERACAELHLDKLSKGDTAALASPGPGPGWP